MNKSDSIASLAQALTVAQGEIRGAPKESTNPYFKSKYADLESVWEAARGPLSKNGLAVVQLPSFEEATGRVCVETMLIHSSGEWISETLKMKPAKEDPQQVGTAISYARRYSLASFVGIYQADDDGNLASGIDTKGKGKPTKEEDEAQNQQLRKETAKELGVEMPADNDPDLVPKLQASVVAVQLKKLEEETSKRKAEEMAQATKGGKPKLVTPPPPPEPEKKAPEISQRDRNIDLISLRSGCSRAKIALHICEALGKDPLPKTAKEAGEMLRATPSGEIDRVIDATVRFVTQHSEEQNRAVILHEDANLWVEFQKMFAETASA